MKKEIPLGVDHLFSQSKRRAPNDAELWGWGVGGTRFSKGCQNFSEQIPSCFLFQHHRAGSHLLAPSGIMGWSSVVLIIALITALLMLGDPGLAPCKQDSMCAFIAVAFKIYLF